MGDTIMTASKYWDGSTWQTVRAIHGPPGPQGPQGVGMLPNGSAGGALQNNYPDPVINRVYSGGLMSVQRDWGRKDGYTQVLSNGELLGNGSGSSLTITTGYTTVPSWWETVLHVGILDKMDSAYGYAYIILELWANSAPGVDQDGLGMAQALATQASIVIRYSTREVIRTWRLAANTYYEVYAKISFSAGTWEYHQRWDTLWMEGKLWPQ